MRLALLGGGGFRVPLVYGALLGDRAEGRITELVLYDVDSGRLTAVARVLAEQAEGVPDAPAVTVTTDLDEALRGADFVFSAIRVGGLEGRAADERIALAEGVLGQETVGAGGIAYGLRTVPVAVEIARRVARLAPDALVINFTNPAGLVTEAMAGVLGDRVVGICDSPVGLGRRVARLLGADPATAWIDYAGLNHLGWLRGLRVGGRDLLPGLLADPVLLGSFEEGRLFGADWLRTLGAVPNEYLHYYYFNRETVAAYRSAERTRGAFLHEQQDGFYAAMRRPGGGSALAAWDRTRAEREATYMAHNRQAAGAGERDAADLESGGYEQVALALMRAVARDERTTLILNVRNRGALAPLDADAVVEVPCLVDGNGAHPVTVSPLTGHAAGLVTAVKAVEREVLAAAGSGSRERAVAAFALHPLVDSVTVARRLVDAYAAAHPGLAYLR
ncbi:MULTISPECIES: 6-phospho-beta-glucosidase [Streptomyces]|uniref:6-phospho-beta-glucosidase n=1 Tax=Streptomyces tsukubensis (strain DSM 42081 / NBRC 108919 / NRRL 18488 / 9993) TaxID=1114943 RepID=I2MTY9_STRT9|nr:MULTISPECIES: 6-phospho-beta-glucosidase [Streptomyces]AZK92790.1 6-phospho-beta-glucosidase [Streptomyces tsukubensis]EIF88236.1 6-phospho-beta-glucosidase [Streptomyces tsukubensis NRRL18488]MYS64889.1 6-phospho-beta-glucosidase [Streptomyces sp. SID5473]QKM71046.1 6-phospho-beta-glucosidase [Streptomyces tsukubensis NRRL18488]TAI41698.1 6-phospho-beta-glucosidase [Streptomyces tsukubensis]